MTSENDRLLLWIYFIGDSDSKSYYDIVYHGPCRGIKSEKHECTGNIGKRIASRLIFHEKTFGGKGHLAETINKLQNYFR